MRLREAGQRVNQERSGNDSVTRRGRAASHERSRVAHTGCTHTGRTDCAASDSLKKKNGKKREKTGGNGEKK